jgi:hypothetical protein
MLPVKRSARQIQVGEAYSTMDKRSLQENEGAGAIRMADYRLYWKTNYIPERH